MTLSTTSPSTITTSMDSPIGELTLTAVGGVLTGVHMNEQRHAPKTPAAYKRDDAGLAHAVEQLNAYFAGEQTDFDLPMTMHGTEFQRRVWASLCEIPYGETISYGELARWVGNPKASRAVGLANGRNPVAIIVPCHRVIGANGSLTGYGGGLERKVWLLEHETAHRSGPVGPGGQAQLDLGTRVAL
ncbi:MAG: methylated-DNA--[protein]-cysteine S-methyltransferase [Solirubrobacteraceae bacterium]